MFSEVPSDLRSVGRSSFGLEGSQPSIRWIESEIGKRVSSPSRVKSAKSERAMLVRSAVATRRVSTGGSITAPLTSGIYSYIPVNSLLCILIQ